MNRIDVTKAQIPDREKFHAYVDRILDSGWFTNRGQYVRELEARLGDYLGVKNIVLVGNGTLALQIAYKALELRGEVITSPFTFIATASSAAWDGLDVRFADIDAASCNIDLAEIQRNISARSCAIVPVHVFGNPCQMDKIADLAKAHSLKVVYDAAHAFSVKYKGQSVLDWGDVSVLSFHATKLFHTIEGGALIINDDDVCTRVRKMINFGITGPETIECMGINAKMNEFQAAMGLCLLDDVDAAILRRGELVALYDALLGEKVMRQVWNADATKNNGYYPVLFASEAITKTVQAALNANEIYPRRYFFPSLDSLAFFSQNSIAPKSRDVASRVLCLPLFSELTEAQCEKICEIILATLED